MKRFFFHTSALIGAAMVPLSAAAQTPPDPNAPAATSEAESDEAIVVTGTRIRNEFNSPSPVQIITTEAAASAGLADTSEVIQNSSLASGSPQNDATISSAFVTDGGPGSQTISLRGLGANRTLVLLNGRRAGPAGTRGGVSAFDLNVLPLSIVDRIDILKDGASSIYGSDAVAGVVNIITRADMDGGEANINYVMPFDDGGEEISGNLTYGRPFSRGHFMVTADYYHQSETLAGDRNYTNCGVDNTYDAATGARTDVIDPRTGQPACRSNTATGLVWLYDYSGGDSLQNGFGPNFIQYDPTGQIGSFFPESIINPPTALDPGAPANWFQTGYSRASTGVTNTNSPFERNSSLYPELERATIYAEGTFALTNRAEAYADVLINRRETRTNGFRQVWTYLYSYDYGDPFSAGWTGASSLSPTVTTDHFDASQTVDYLRIVGGVRGDFDGWLGPINWDIYVQNSNSEGDYTTDVILEDAVYSSDGRSDFGSFGLIRPNSIPRDTASCVGYVTPISGRNCVDVDWLSPTLLSGGGFTPEEEAFLYATDTGHTSYDQTYIEGIVTGDLFTLPAGNVGFALGATTRRDSINDVPGEITRAGNSWGLSSAGITKGEDTTTELFGEVSIPLLRGAPLAESLTLSLSDRQTHVESYGSNNTYKIGLNWQLTPEFMLRATHGTSFRAPALFELYLAAQTSFQRQSAVDPCVNWGQQLDLGNIPERVALNCAADGIADDYTGTGSGIEVTSSGGLGLLDPETSEATVVGFVWSPRFIDLNLSVDYFEIEVSDEVGKLGPAQIVYSCYNSENFPTDPLCDLFTRVGGTGPSQFLIDSVNDSYLNINSQTNRGIDLTASYAHEFPWGDFTVDAQATYQLEDVTALFAGTERDVNGSNGDPEMVGSLDFQFERGPWTAFWRVQYIGEADDSVFTDNLGGALDIEAEAVTYNTASLRYEWDTWSLIGGVQNIFDQEPPTVSTTGAASQTTIGPSILASQYDYIGRSAFIRVKKEW